MDKKTKKYQNDITAAMTAANRKHDVNIERHLNRVNSLKDDNGEPLKNNNGEIIIVETKEEIKTETLNPENNEG